MSRVYFHHLCYQNLTLNKVIHLERGRGEISGQLRKGKLTPSKTKMGTHKDEGRCIQKGAAQETASLKV